MSPFPQLVLDSPRRLAMPLAVYPGATLTGARVRDIVTSPAAQFEVAAALHERFRTPCVLTAMDLSVEAEAFGARVVMVENEIPTVTGRLVADLAGANALTVPQMGDRRTRVYLETVERLTRLPRKPLVLGGCIGPFSLAGRLAGVSETLELTLSNPALVHALLDKTAAFLTAYARAFQAAGADGVIMAEPGAGLLSPRGMAEFSSAYIRRVVAAVADERFSIIVHNCAARVLHLPSLLQAGAHAYHFSAPMDLGAALRLVPPDVVLCGNLDPTTVFHRATPSETAARTRALLDATRGHRNFVISSGCDVPPLAPLENLAAFFETVAQS